MSDDDNSLCGASQPDAGDDPDRDVRLLVRDGRRATALELLMQRHGLTVYRYCREVLRDPALADDVQQQVFIEVFRDLASFSGRSTLRTWLLAITRHRVVDAIRARRRARARMRGDELAELSQAPDPRPSPAESVDRMRLRQALVASLDGLRPEVRATLLMRFRDDCTFSEIARSCGETPSALHARVIRALPVLRAAIAHRLGHDSW